jgi:hypothetical protein
MHQPIRCLRYDATRTNSVPMGVRIRKPKFVSVGTIVPRRRQRSSRLPTCFVLATGPPMNERIAMPRVNARACTWSHRSTLRVRSEPFSSEAKDSYRTNIDVAFTPCVRGPHTLACSFLAVASFWRCPAYPERPGDQAELALYRLRSNEAFHRRADRCLRDLMPFPFSRERTLQSAWS